MLAEADRIAEMLPASRRCEFDRARTAYLTVRPQLNEWARQTCEGHLLELAKDLPLAISLYAKDPHQVA